MPSVGPRLAVALVLAMSPPVPGSEAMVPHQAPSQTFRKIDRRCPAHASSKGGGACAVAIQKFSTTGCIAQTKAEARAELVRRGVEIGGIQDFGGGVKGADFSDPDGNTFELQEMAWRKGAKY